MHAITCKEGVARGLRPLLPDRRTLSLLAEVSCVQSCFILRGELYVRGKGLLRTIKRTTQHLVDLDAARSIYKVRVASMPTSSSLTV